MMSSMLGNRGMLGSSGRGNQVPKGYEMGQLQQYSPEQMQLFQQLFSHVGRDSYLSKLAGGDRSFFEEQEAPARRQFNAIQGNLASRFSGYGGPGSLSSRRSSGFQNASTQASSEFAQDLQSRRQQLQHQAIRDLMGLSSDLLSQRPYEQFLTPKPKSFLQELLGSLMPGIGEGIGTGVGDLISRMGSRNNRNPFNGEHF